jgi:light-regulated signal transduction histidine kinase (bacteriophytochrome)
MVQVDETLDSMTGFLLLLGALVIGVAAVRARSVYVLAKGTPIAGRWAGLSALLLLFVVIYLLAFALHRSGAHELLVSISGVAAVVGACFVFLVVHLGLATIAQLNSSLMAEKVEAQKAEGMLRELTIINERITNSNRALEQFAYVTSHDLQEPLRKITAFGDLLASSEAERLSDDGKDYVVRMQKAARRMSELINALLSLSRMSAEKEQATAVDLNALVAEILEDLEIAVANASAKVFVGSLPTIEGRPVQLRQLFQNLMGNALKFRREGVVHEIRVEARTEGKNRVLSVSDNGIGVEPQYAERIFGIFQRLHGRNTFEGTGIGLSICQRVAANHGWGLKAVGRPNEGASFELNLGKEEQK